MRFFLLLTWSLLAMGIARAADYVVDQTAPGAADNNPGTAEQPFLTIQRAADVVAPGDCVNVMAGRYDERVRLIRSGAKGARIVFDARPRRRVVVNGFDVGGDCVVIRGFEITAEKPATAVQLNASHCEVLDNYIHGMRVGVAGTVGKIASAGGARDYSTVAHNRIAYNKVDHCEYGFMLGGNDWLVENNEVSRLFMYDEGRTHDDCDYSRFFGEGCVQRYNYYHGSVGSEIRVAHVDCLQTFTVNGEIANDLIFEYNTCFDFHQMCMVESAPHIGSVRNWTIRGNIVAAGSPALRGAWGPNFIQTPEVTIEQNTIGTVQWGSIGLRGAESTQGRIVGNILFGAERPLIQGDEHFTTANPVVEHNLTFATRPLAAGNNIDGEDPLLVNAAGRNFRLRAGSPAIRAGKGGRTIGALEYPNVYWVDPQHPAASDEPGWGYPAVPFATVAKACELAEPGSTILLRGGIYREVLPENRTGIAILAKRGENVVFSGADVVEGWKREGAGSWSTRLSGAPRKLLRDGQLWTSFSYDGELKVLRVYDIDPRLHLYETVVRQRAPGVTGDFSPEGIVFKDVLED